MTVPTPASPLRPRMADHGPLAWAFFTANRAVVGYAGDLLRELGLHPGWDFLLMQLFDRGEQLQSDLLKAVGLDHSTLSKSLRRMQEAGLVVRRPADHDRRAMVVGLTEKGEALREPLACQLGTLEEAFAGFREEGSRDAMIAALAEIESNLVRQRAEHAVQRGRGRT